MHVIGSQAICVTNDGSATATINVLTDSAGAAVAGTPIAVSIAASTDQYRLGASPTELHAVFASASASASKNILSIGIAGNNPVINRAQSAVGAAGSGQLGKKISVSPSYMAGVKISGSVLPTDGDLSGAVAISNGSVFQVPKVIDLSNRRSAVSDNLRVGYSHLYGSTYIIKRIVAA
jgi:hypothetical protein